nr:TatD family hydrolase [Paracoccaceae bacterium]
PYRGKRNEPAYTVHTAEAGAALFGMDYEAFARQTTVNFDRLFAKAAAWAPEPAASP